MPLTRSKRFDSTRTGFGVVKSVPLARLKRTTFPRNVAAHCQSAFSTASPAPTPSGSGSRSVSVTSSAPCRSTATTVVSAPVSSVSPSMKRRRSPGANTSKPTACGCMYRQRMRVDETTFVTKRHVECTFIASSIMPSNRQFSTSASPATFEKCVASAWADA